MLHDPADNEIAVLVANGVDIDFGCVFQESIDKHRTLSGESAFLSEAAETRELRHRDSQTFIVIDNLHRPTAEHITRTNKHRIADPRGDGERRIDVCCGATSRLRDLKTRAQRIPEFAILGSVD